MQDALCVLYTPDKEHFGIVPLEVREDGTRLRGPLASVGSDPLDGEGN